MSESVAPKAAQNEDEISEQQDSSERVKIASDARASTHPPQAEDDDWLDGMDTVPAPRGSEPPQSEAIVPAPIVSVASAENPPAPEPSESKIVSIAERRRERGKKKKRRPTAASSKQKPPARPEPAVAQEPRPGEGFSIGPWLLIAAVAGVAGLWFVSRSGSEQALPSETRAQATTTEATALSIPAPPVEAPATAAPSEPAPLAQVEPPAEPARVEPPPAMAEPSAAASEPARIAAFKAVVEATKSARTCRHRGDASGKVPVVVEFGSDGRVQRTDVKTRFANPMTSRCIASRLAEATIPAFAGAPILITADVSLR